MWLFGPPFSEARLCSFSRLAGCQRDLAGLAVGAFGLITAPGLCSGLSLFVTLVTKRRKENMGLCATRML